MGNKRRDYGSLVNTTDYQIAASSTRLQDLKNGKLSAEDQQMLEDLANEFRTEFPINTKEQLQNFWASLNREEGCMLGGHAAIVTGLLSQGILGAIWWFIIVRALGLSKGAEVVAEVVGAPLIAVASVIGKDRVVWKYGKETFRRLAHFTSWMKDIFDVREWNYINWITAFIALGAVPVTASVFGYLNPLAFSTISLILRERFDNVASEALIGFLSHRVVQAVPQALSTTTNALGLGYAVKGAVQTTTDIIDSALLNPAYRKRCYELNRHITAAGPLEWKRYIEDALNRNEFDKAEAYLAKLTGWEIIDFNGFSDLEIDAILAGPHEALKYIQRALRHSELHKEKYELHIKNDETDKANDELEKANNELKKANRVLRKITGEDNIKVGDLPASALNSWSIFATQLPGWKMVDFSGFSDNEIAAILSGPSESLKYIQQELKHNRFDQANKILRKITGDIKLKVEDFSPKTRDRDISFLLTKHAKGFIHLKHLTGEKTQELLTQQKQLVEDGKKLRREIISTNKRIKSLIRKGAAADEIENLNVEKERLKNLVREINQNHKAIGTQLNQRKEYIKAIKDNLTQQRNDGTLAKKLLEMSLEFSPQAIPTPPSNAEQASKIIAILLAIATAYGLNNFIPISKDFFAPLVNSLFDASTAKIVLDVLAGYEMTGMSSLALGIITPLTLGIGYRLFGRNPGVTILSPTEESKITAKAQGWANLGALPNVCQSIIIGQGPAQWVLAYLASYLIELCAMLEIERENAENAAKAGNFLKAIASDIYAELAETANVYGLPSSEMHALFNHLEQLKNTLTKVIIDHSKVITSETNVSSGKEEEKDPDIAVLPVNQPDTETNNLPEQTIQHSQPMPSASPAPERYWGTAIYKSVSHMFFGRSAATTQSPSINDVSETQSLLRRTSFVPE